jgi:hypothetical protein
LGEYEFFSKEQLFKVITEDRPDNIEPFVAIWNLFGTEYKFPLVKAISKKRLSWFSERIKEPAFDFCKILSQAKKSAFLKGKSWFGFDWVIKSEENYLKILEGKYFSSDVQSISDGVDTWDKDIHRHNLKTSLV